MSLSNPPNILNIPIEFPNICKNHLINICKKLDYEFEFYDKVDGDVNYYRWGNITMIINAVQSDHI